MEQRPAIPTEVRRSVLLEAGHRCAIHTCQHTDVEVHHIEPWAQCKEHNFENLIALCPNCHKLVESGKIDRKSLHRYKARLRAKFNSELGAETPTNSVSGNGTTPVDSDSCSTLWRTKSIEEDRSIPPTYSVSAEYPCFDLISTEKSEEINAAIYGMVKHEIALFRRFPLEIIKSSYGPEPEFLPHCTLSSSYDVSLLAPPLLSMRQVFTSYTGGAYSNTHFRSLSFQLEPKVFLLDLWSLFRDSFKSLRIISEYCMRELCSLYEIDELPWKKGAAPEEENYRNFNLHKHGISFYFDEHQLGGKALGAPSIFVPYDVIKNELYRESPLHRLRWAVGSTPRSNKFMSLKVIDCGGRTIEHPDSKGASLRSPVIMERAQNLLAKRVSELPLKWDVEKCYYFTSKRSTKTELLSFPNPLAPQHRLSSIQELTSVRLVPLFVIPRQIEQQAAPEILLKFHEQWKWVLPSAEVGEEFPKTLSSVFRQINSGRRVPAILQGISVPKVKLGGGIVSFARSATDKTSTCYVFPLVLVQATLHAPKSGVFSVGDRIYQYVPKSFLEACLAPRAKEKNWPNLDVYKALLKIFPLMAVLNEYAFNAAPVQDCEPALKRVTIENIEHL